MSSLVHVPHVIIFYILCVLRAEIFLGRRSHNEDINNFVRFQVLTAASMMFRIVFLDVLPCKMIVDRRFRGAYCLHHQCIPEDNSEHINNLL
jgi:hypothetical protein